MPDHMVMITGKNVGTQQCPSCASGELLMVSFDVEDTKLVFRSCNLCETKWWEQDGAEVEFSSVRPLVSQI